MLWQLYWEAHPFSFFFPMTWPQKGLAAIPISLLLDLRVLIVKQEWWLRQGTSYKRRSAMQIALRGVLALPWQSGPCYHAAAETVCRIREKLNANGDGIWIRCLGASFRRQGRGVADRQRFLPPPPPPTDNPALPPILPSHDSPRTTQKIRFIKL